MVQTLLFEIHNTYDVPQDQEEQFREQCIKANCKPVIIKYKDNPERTDEYMFKRIVTTEDFGLAKQTALDLVQAFSFPCLRVKVELRCRPDHYPKHFDDEVLYYELHTKSLTRSEHTSCVIEIDWSTSINRIGSQETLYTYRTRDRAKAYEVFYMLNLFCEFELTLYDSNPDYDFDWCKY